MLVNMHIKNNLTGFFKGFGYAVQGIIYCVKTQRNMRFHIGVVGIVFMLSLIRGLSSGELLVLLLTIGGVTSLECVNTAIENAVDLASKGKISLYAKAAKDCGAGAVLVFSVFALFVGIKIFGNRKTFALLYDFVIAKPWFAVIFLVYIALWILWILKTDNNKDKD